ncbi:PAS domain-containing protein [Macrophomina phaseolina MS6]|uniref:PAS domain-containing protein n=2 Tax=Macrophomina phaseolina TaxID=35725 RepID=K2S6T4_MACPH|nr:PAS domain-containing protein [Macrophomina phaseolina MS6]
MYARLAGQTPFQSRALHERYGKVVRVSPNELSFTDADAWKDIYGYGNKEVLGREPNNAPKIREQEPSLVAIVDPDEHRRVRNMFNPAFSQRALKEQEALLLKHINLFVDKVREKSAENAHGVIDLCNFFNFTTFDIMGDLAFGAPLGLLERAEYTSWVRNAFAGMKLFAIRSAISYYFPPIDYVMPLLLPRSLKRKRAAHMRYAADQVRERVARKTDRPDIWTLVLRSEKVSLSEGEMESNAGVFMIAGTETTATLLSGATYLLLTHPAALARLVREIRGSFDRRELMSIEALQRLPWLNAVVDEALRCYPPVPDSLFRRVPPEGATIAGRWIPGGATVQLTQWAAYQTEEYFRDAHRFAPERWLAGGDEGDGAEYQKYSGDERKVFQPFGVGPRSCLGMNLAYHEIRLMLSYLLWHFDLELCKESENWMDQKVFVLWSKNPLMVKVKPVEGR